MTDSNNAAVQALDGLAQAMLGSVQPLIDAQIAKEIEAQKAKIGIRRHEIVINGEVRAEIKGKLHPAFDKVLKLVSAGLHPLLIGPAGCGKTKLAADVAKALKLSFSSISGSAGASESQLIGRLMPTGEGGRFEYHCSPFVKQYEEGGAFLFDEMDAFDPNMVLVVNQALSNGGFFVEARHEKPFVKRHEASILIGAANTWGNGADMIYVGRNQLDGSTLDRFYPVFMDYDRDIEAEYAPSNVCNWVWSIREKASQARLRRIISTRMIQKMGAAIDAGLSFSEVKSDLLNGWSKDELAKIGEA